MEDNRETGNLEEPIINKEEKESFSKRKKIILLILIVTIIISVCILIAIILIKKSDDEDEDTSTISPIYINPISNYTHCIIWLHGLDNCPEKFVDLFTNEINIPHKNNTKIILLRAPKMKMSYNGKELTSWFDIYHFPINSSDTYSFPDANYSSNILKKYIDEEAKILGNYEKIFIGGHSQGACISLYTGYSLEDLIGGVIVCSGILFPQAEIVGDKENLNVYLGHGDRDQAIPFEFHKQTVERIQEFKGVRKYYYEGHGHSIFEPEKKDIEKFLNETMV